MAATTAAAATASRCRTTTFFHLSLPKPPPSSPKFSPLPKQIILYSNFPLQISSQSAALISTMNRRSVSSPESAVVEEEEVGESGTPPSDDDVSLDSASLPPLTGCKACGREDIESGCNGEGRIQGGIATVPGFGWWPIKAYRPCPAYVASGGRYRRTGQSMDEVVSGSGGRAASNRTSDGTDSSKKKGPKKLKT